MSEYSTPNDLNTYLCNNSEYKNIEEYFKLYSTTFTPNLDLAFVPEFLELVNNKNKLCITHYKLIEYGVITFNSIKSIKECILKCNSDDFTITDKHYKEMSEKEYYEQLGLEGSPSKPNGGRPSKIIVITPFIFKLCLIRSINKKKYAMYYLLLEECLIEYNKYQIMYKDMLLSGKDTKIDEQSKKLDNQSKKIDILLKQNEDLLGYAKGAKQSNEELKQSVHRLEIKIDELLKLVHKFLSNQITLIYTFNNNVTKTKVLIIYKLQKNNKFHLVLRYCQLEEISKSISSFCSKKINTDFKIKDYIVIGAIQENVITIQSIYNSIEDIDKMNKQTLTEMNEVECDNLISNVFNVVTTNKQNLFTQNLQENEILSEHCDSMMHLTNLDNKFNKEINNTILKYLDMKIKDKKNFSVKKISTELKSIYDKYKTN